MPMKAMIYKTLSTVVDDFFAYAVHRICNPSNDLLTLCLLQFLHQDADPPPPGVFS